MQRQLVVPIVSGSGRHTTLGMYLDRISSSLLSDYSSKVKTPGELQAMDDYYAEKRGK